MVDIDLFKDEDEEQQDWGGAPEGEEEISGDVKSDLDLGDDFQDTPDLDAEGILDDEEAIPDFEEPDDTEDYDDYEYGDVKEKKTSPVLWILLGLIVIFAALYYLNMIPGFSRSAKPRRPPAVTMRRKPVITVQDTTKKAGTAAIKRTPPGVPGQIAPGKIMVAQGRLATLQKASASVLNDLASAGQFGTFMVDGDRFSVQYVSETPGVSAAMAEKLKTLLEASEVKASSEDRERSNDRIVYLGVVSGKLPEKQTGTGTAEKQPFASIQQFENQVKTLAGQQNIQNVKTDNVASSAEGQQRLVRIRAEGSQADIMKFLKSLGSLQGKMDTEKLLLVPSDYSDYKATNLKLIVETRIHISKNVT